MGNSNLLFESIFKRKLSDADTREYLREITSEYPYFSPAQFFLLLQTEKGTTEYHELAAKTSVLFNNVHWLQFQLEEQQQTAEEVKADVSANDGKWEPIESQETFFPPTTRSNETIDKHETNHTDHPAKEIISINVASFSKDEALSLPTQEADIKNIAKEEDLVIDEAALLPPGGSTETAIQANITAPGADEKIIAETDINIDGNIIEKEIEPVFEEGQDLSQPEEKKEEPIVHEKNIYTVHNERATLSVPENEHEIINIPHSGHFNNEDSPLVNETEADEEPVTEQEIEPLHFKLNLDPVNTTEKDIVFEPLHTSDYFASVGIKLNDEIKPSDKLGKQLKSFTEWLKTMKKVHNDQLPPLSGQADISIQKLAEQSNKEDAVVTEAMADVLLRQGKAEKAIEVYKKLSLLNPSKSTYFAAKIDQHKEH